MNKTYSTYKIINLSTILFSNLGQIFVYIPMIWDFRKLLCIANKIIFFKKQASLIDLLVDWGDDNFINMTYVTFLYNIVKKKKIAVTSNN